MVEICGIAKDAVFDPSNTDIPSVFANQRPALATLTEGLHRLALTILHNLAKHLEVPVSTLEALHDPSHPSSTVLRFLHNLPQPDGAAEERQMSLMGHTDNGSLTILFTQLGGLQILPTGASEDDHAAWRWVRPEPGCAIVNIGDSLVQWTGGILRSAFHRVLHPPGEQAALDRYSFGYFLKPANHASMRRISDGSVIPKLSHDEEDTTVTYAEWHSSKTKGIMQGKNTVSRGGKHAVSKSQSQPIAT